MDNLFQMRPFTNIEYFTHNVMKGNITDKHSQMLLLLLLLQIMMKTMFNFKKIYKINQFHL